MMKFFLTACRSGQNLTPAMLFGGLFLLLAGCATTNNSDHDYGQAFEKIEGYWRLGDGVSIAEIAPCKRGRGSYCGRLIVFAGDPKARDYQTPDMMAWGQRLCGSTIISKIKPTDDPRVFSGRFYEPDQGRNYHLLLLVKEHDVLEASIYLGAGFDEVIEMAVGAAFGSSPDMFTALSFLTRAGIGKEHLGKSENWQRVRAPQGRCDRPQVR